MRGQWTPQNNSNPRERRPGNARIGSWKYRFGNVCARRSSGYICAALCLLHGDNTMIPWRTDDGSLRRYPSFLLERGDIPGTRPKHTTQIMCEHRGLEKDSRVGAPSRENVGCERWGPATLHRSHRLSPDQSITGVFEPGSFYPLVFFAMVSAFRGFLPFCLSLTH